MIATWGLCLGPILRELIYYQLQPSHCNTSQHLLGFHFLSSQSCLLMGLFGRSTFTSIRVELIMIVHWAVIRSELDQIFSLGDS